jgi:hypothetical protein
MLSVKAGSISFMRQHKFHTALPYFINYVIHNKQNGV